jgi:hypothetical protein
MSDLILPRCRSCDTVDQIVEVTILYRQHLGFTRDEEGYHTEHYAGDPLTGSNIVECFDRCLECGAEDTAMASDLEDDDD